MAGLYIKELLLHYAADCVFDRYRDQSAPAVAARAGPAVRQRALVLTVLYSQQVSFIEHKRTRARLQLISTDLRPTLMAVGLLFAIEASLQCPGLQSIEWGSIFV